MQLRLRQRRNELVRRDHLPADVNHPVWKTQIAKAKVFRAHALQALLDVGHLEAGRNQQPLTVVFTDGPADCEAHGPFRVISAAAGPIGDKASEHKARSLRSHVGLLRVDVDAGKLLGDLPHPAVNRRLLLLDGFVAQGLRPL